MNTVTVVDLLAAWPLAGPWSVQPPVTGGNNLSYPVVAPSGRYFLRVYQNTVDPGRVRYEHAILTQLAQAGLSFAVSAPIPLSDEMTVLVIGAGATRQLAALFPHIAGAHPEGATLEQLRRCGTALAELDQALAHIDVPAPPRTFPPFGQLAHIHPAVPRPREIAEQVALESAEQARLVRVFDDLAAAIPRLYGTLPRQIVHRDFDASNVLMADGRVTGVLDFEFAGPDLRALDLVRSLSQFTVPPWSSPDGWGWVAAFVAGYQECIRLDADEIAALPDLLRLQRLVSLIHREGRRRQGLARAVDVQARARALLNGDAWLRERGQDLMALFEQAA